MSSLWCTALNRHLDVPRGTGELVEYNTAAMPEERFEILT